LAKQVPIHQPFDHGPDPRADLNDGDGLGRQLVSQGIDHALVQGAIVHGLFGKEIAGK